MQMLPACRCHRMIAWAEETPWTAAIELIVSSVKSVCVFPLPPSGNQLSRTVPYLAMCYFISLL